MNLCKYKNIFGEPGKGFHSLRIFNMAFNDLFVTIILAVIFAIFLNKKLKNFVLSFILTFSCLMTVAIILHRIFCVNTTINKLIFGYVN